MGHGPTGMDHLQVIDPRLQFRYVPAETVRAEHALQAGGHYRSPGAVQDMEGNPAPEGQLDLQLNHLVHRIGVEVQGDGTDPRRM